MALLSRPAKGSTLFYRFSFQRFKQVYQTPPQTSSDSGPSKCIKLDSVKLGIKRSMISRDSYKVVKDLQIGGFETYLVGGCVRDLLLNKVPKDFDVITTAKLDMVKQKFRRAIIVGKRFPVCRVIFKNSVVEVTSFGTVDKHFKRKKVSVSQMPAGCNKNDSTRWNDCMRRDFTINSLLYDPFDNTVFDYIDAMKDLKSMMLRTIMPATLSLKEDQARILRGIRLAARLGLSFSKETETAIHDLSSSVAHINTSRLIMEINYMLSYGAAEASLLLLEKFKLLEILLPFQAAYLSELLDIRIDPRCLLLMKLLFNLDQLITCDRPCDSSLWVALLSFHMVLFINPQPAEVVLTFASLLHHGKWEKSITFARQHAPQARIHLREIYVDSITLSDDEIVERVTQLAKQAKNSVCILTSKDCLKEAMTRFPESPNSDFIFISRNMGKQAKKIFDVLADVRCANAGKICMGIDYKKLGEGNIAEMRFLLGQIILDALTSNATGERDLTKLKKVDENGPEQIREVLGKQDAPTERRKDEATGERDLTKLKKVDENGPEQILEVLGKQDAPTERRKDEATGERDLTKLKKVDENGPEQILEVLGKQDAPTERRKDEATPKTENKQNSSSNNKLLPKYAPKARIIRDDGIVTEVTLGRDNVKDDGPEQLVEVLEKMPDAPTDPIKDEPKPKTKNKRNSSSNNKLLPKYAKTTRIIRDDGIVTEVTLSSIMNPDNNSQRLGSRKVETDKHVKTETREKVSLSSLFR